MSATQSRTQHLDAQFAELRQQVTGLDTEQTEIKKGLFALNNKFDAGFRDLAEKLERRNIFPMATFLIGIGVILSIVTLVGGLARQPIVDGINENHADLKANATLRREEDSRQRAEMAKIRAKVDYLYGRLDASLSSPLKRP